MVLIGPTVSFFVLSILLPAHFLTKHSRICFVVCTNISKVHWGREKLQSTPPPSPRLFLSPAPPVVEALPWVLICAGCSTPVARWRELWTVLLTSSAFKYHAAFWKIAHPAPADELCPEQSCYGTNNQPGRPVYRSQ